MNSISLPGELLSFNANQKPIFTKNSCEPLQDSHLLVKAPVYCQDNISNQIEIEGEESRKNVRLYYKGETYVPSEGDMVIGIVTRRFMGIFTFDFVKK